MAVTGVEHETVRPGEGAPRKPQPVPAAPHGAPNGEAANGSHSVGGHADTSHAAPPQKPVIVQKKQGGGFGRFLIWVLVLAGLGAGIYFAWRYYQNATAQKATAANRAAVRPQPVIAAKSYRGDLPIYLPALGNVQAYNSVIMRTRVDGQIMAIHFSEGQLVHEGDLLFEIDPRPYRVQLTQAQGQMAKDEATLINARLDLTRYEAAAEAISKQQVDTARAAVTSAEGVVKADQGAIDSANLNLIYTHITAPITGKIGLRMVDVGNMVHASDSTGLAVIAQTQPISVVFSLAEDHLPELQKAMSHQNSVTADAWDRDDLTKISSGALEALDNQIDPTTATVRLKATFRNEDNTLYPNQFVNVHLLVDTLKQVVLIPDVAVQHSPTSDFVYVVTDTPPAKEGDSAATQASATQEAVTRRERPIEAAAQSQPAATQGGPKPQYVEMRPITLGPTQGHLTVIEQGLGADEVVVTDGVDKLQPGSPVFVHLANEGVGQRGATTAPGARGQGRGRGRAGGAATTRPAAAAGGAGGAGGLEAGNR